MRKIERIEPFIAFAKDNLEKIFTQVWKIPFDEQLNDIFKDGSLINLWKANQDWRFSQLLINCGIVPNYSGFWYHKEESEIIFEINNC